MKLIRIIAGTPGLESDSLRRPQPWRGHAGIGARRLERGGLRAQKLARARVSHRERRARRSRPRRRRRRNQDLQSFSDPDLPFGGEPEPDAIIPPSPELKLTMYVSRDDKALQRLAGCSEASQDSGASTRRCSRLTRSN